MHGLQLISWNLFILAGLVIFAALLVAAALAWRNGARVSRRRRSRAAGTRMTGSVPGTRRHQDRSLWLAARSAGTSANSPAANGARDKKRGQGPVRTTTGAAAARDPGARSGGSLTRPPSRTATGQATPRRRRTARSGLVNSMSTAIPMMGITMMTEVA